MWEYLPDSETVRAIVEWLAFVVLVALVLGVGFFGLALGVMGLDKVKREGKKLLGRTEVLTLADGIAAVNVKQLHTYVDDPGDALIILLAQQLRQDPAALVRGVDKLFVIFGQLQMVWPQVKDGLGLEQPPKPAEGAEPAGTP